MRKTIIPFLLASAICASPAYANWFSNPQLGINLNVGSAPNPKPAPLVVAAIPPPAPPPAYEPLPPLPPPPPLVEAPPAPPPPAPLVRKFMVFFDFDKSNITPEARQIISEAVQTAKQLGPVRITVTGHTDTVGSFRYNQALSERRARAVKSEMMRLGMNASDIDTVGRSFSDPLVPTGKGVREPQNRRAVIDLGTGGPVASLE
jgi:OOP family OmpA-OmpF porin